jgi:hypothetical protein
MFLIIIIHEEKTKEITCRIGLFQRGMKITDHLILYFILTKWIKIDKTNSVYIAETRGAPDSDFTIRPDTGFAGYLKKNPDGYFINLNT